MQSIGIDIEQISLLPSVATYGEDSFYTMNFSSSEISYCVLQPNPAASFAGLFAAKEAIIKADNNFGAYNFNTIIIDHLPNGKPVHPQFSISISHAADYAIAVAVSISKNPVNTSLPVLSDEPGVLKRTLFYSISFSALIIAVILLIVTLLFKK